METELKNLIGKTINKIFISQEHLKFETDMGDYVYEVEGDCCSHSYFYDFYGVKNILGKKVKDVSSVDLLTGDVFVTDQEGDEIKVYGYQIFIEDESWGEMTGVFSFRNSSNGYYGGEIKQVLPRDEINLHYITSYQERMSELRLSELMLKLSMPMTELTDDIIEVCV